jgi:hypothetical protein
LRHRLRKDPLESVDSGLRIEQAANEVFSHNQVRSLVSAG